MVQRLDYLEAWVDAIWITPLYPSPQIDFGYDISDYRAIDPQLRHARGLRPPDPRGRQARHTRAARHGAATIPRTSIRGSPRRRVSRGSTRHDFYVWSDGTPRRRPPPAAQQLGEPVRRLGLGVRARGRPVLLPQVLPPAAGPELAQPGGRARDVRGDALLAAARRSRLPAGCHHRAVRGRAAARRAGPGRHQRTWRSGPAAHLYRQPAGDPPRDPAPARHDRHLPGRRVLVGETYLPSTATSMPGTVARATTSCTYRWIPWSGSAADSMRRLSASA